MESNELVVIKENLKHSNNTNDQISESNILSDVHNPKQIQTSISLFDNFDKKYLLNNKDSPLIENEDHKANSLTENTTTTNGTSIVEGSTNVMDMSIPSVSFLSQKNSEIPEAFQHTLHVTKATKPPQQPIKMCNSEFTDNNKQRNKLQNNVLEQQRTTSMIDCNRNKDNNPQTQMQDNLEMKPQVQYRKHRFQEQIQHRFLQERQKHTKRQQKSQFGNLPIQSDNTNLENPTMLTKPNIVEYDDDKASVVDINQTKHNKVNQTDNDEDIQNKSITSKCSSQSTSIMKSMNGDERVNYLEAKVRVLISQLRLSNDQLKTLKSRDEVLTSEIHEKNMQQIEAGKKEKDFQSELISQDIRCKVALNRVSIHIIHT